VSHCSALGLYTNLITSAVLIDRKRMQALAAAGLNHVQISFQAHDPANADRIGGYAGGHARKIEAAGCVREAGLPLTVNAVMHRQNLHELDAVIDLAVRLGARRLEVAHAQYYGWALKNRAALMPSRAQLERATATVGAARARLKGTLVIDYVVPDYYARRPKACMGGWGRRFLNVSPSGDVLPCHAASTLPGMSFENVKDRSLREIWYGSAAFEKFRGTGWMPEPCRSCDQREIDWGGCRCQAFALTGGLDAVDPACEFAGGHAELVASAERESAAPAPEFIYRRIGAAAPASLR
jgi:pyrroloquinoline quinone biosynthesis protein E